MSNILNKKETDSCLGALGILAVGAVVAGVVLSPLLVPGAILVGIVGAPIFALKALGHKISLESHKKEKTYSSQNEMDKLEQERDFRKSLAKAKSLAVCIIPLGFLTQIITPISSKRAVELDKEIKRRNGN